MNFKYDNLGRLTDRTLNTGGAVNFTTKYSFQAGVDANTTTTKVSELDNNGSKILYTYDPNGNIETITESEKVIKYYYDGLNQLTREDNKVLDKTITYTYDAGGNILSKTEYAYTTGTLGEATSTVSYGYTDTNWKDKLTNYNGKPIEYYSESEDGIGDIGNPKNYDGYTFTWEQGRQLAGIDGNGKDIDFKYNVDGIRTEKTVDGVTTKYRLVGDKVTFEDNGTDKIYYTYDASSDLVSMNLNGVEYWHIRNAQGDITGLFDENGTEVVKYTYDSWGKLVSTTGSLASTVGAKNPYRYRGYRYDTETGLYYLQSRYYNAEWGRFINIDSIGGKVGVLLSHNVFAYSNNNPTNMVDPSGHFAFALSFVAETVTAVGATIGAVLSSPVVLAGAITAATCFLGYAVYTYYTSTTNSSSGKLSSSENIDAEGGGSPNSPNNNNDDKDPKGFKSFRQLKRYLGPAGAGKAWHHIVEQTSANVSRFGAEAIHNIENIMKLDHGKGSIHAKISGYYSSIQPFSKPLRVRQWLSTKSFQEQYEFGMKIIKLFENK